MSKKCSQCGHELPDNYFENGESRCYLCDLPFENLIFDFIGFSLNTFAGATPLSSLNKLRKETDELEHAIITGENKAEEYVDCLMCIFDSAARSCITPKQLIAEFQNKLNINKSRTWVKNPDNTYSH